MKKISLTSGTAEQQYRWLPLVFILLLTAFVLLMLKKFPDDQRFSVVQLQAKGGAINLSKAYQLAFFRNGLKHNGSLLAEKKDWLGSTDYSFPWLQSKEDSLLLEEKGDSVLYVNGNIQGIIIQQHENLLPFFSSMKKEAFASQFSISIRDTIPGSYIPGLKKLAGWYPHATLLFEEKDSLDLVGEYLRKADFFEPSYISLPVTNESINRLSHWKNAECIYINLTDSVIDKPLPPIPSMKECIVFGDHIVSIIPGFFSQNTQLKKLSLLLDAPFFNLVTPLENLDELVLHYGEETASVKELKGRMENLSVLILSGNCTETNMLTAARKLKWIGLPVNTSQAEFNQLTSRLTHLQVLELCGSDAITDFTSLKELPDLRGLVITDTVTDKATLCSLNKLRYLSVPMENKADSTYVQELDKALPGCIVVANSGACLGSGWLLVLAPVVILFMFLLKPQPGKHDVTATDTRHN